MNPALLFAIQLFQSLPGLIAAGVEIKGLVDEYTAKLESMAAQKRDPSADEWLELNARIVSLRQKLHAS